MDGLGFKEGTKWNKVLLAKFIWALSSKQDVLWVKWIDELYLKGQSFWNYTLKSDVSWYWRNLCYLKEMFLEEDLEASTVNVKLNLKVLYSCWLQRDPVSFAKAVWSRLTVPKHCFILWQSVLGHLMTRDNLMHCQISVASSLCPVCERVEESHMHLFFDCIFSQHVLELIKIWLGPAIWPVQYEDWKNWLEGKPKDLMQHIAVASLAAAVYCIWFNKNSCIFAHCSFSSHCIDCMIKLGLKARLLSILSRKLLDKNRSLAEFVRKL
ncbi:uncharacterized protein LOC133792469 [Humulus lupulus]|uniref:uncharacterized protein LOC133792469 n=1 Tax=Humulus lupulus TaxID=3486 RepID=UPI002B416DA4|nr:uncharacterized protein LOC133792469 [Humulus lupulus]